MGLRPGVASSDMTNLEAASSKPGPLSATSPLRGGAWVAPDSGALMGDSAPDASFVNGRYLTRSFVRGDVVFRAGDAADGFYLVLAGRVKIVLPDPVRGERVVAVCGEGDLFGATACGGAPAHRAEAISLQEGTLVVSLSCAELREASKDTPAVALLLARALAARVQVLEEAAEFASLPVQARLARTLLDLAKRLGSEVEPGIYDLELALRQDEIASLAGATRVSATQALGAWGSMGIVSGTRGAYKIDVARLTALMELLEDSATR